MNGNGSYVSVNGLDLYYEIRELARRLVLLPGGFMTIELMGPLVAVLGGDTPGDRRRAPRPWPHGRHRSPVYL